MGEKRPDIWRVAAGVLAFLVPLLVYLRTLAPSLTWAHDGADGGDFVAAALTRGIPHPPGYPTYLAMLRGTLTLPFGNPAYRANMLSAVCAAGATFFLFLAVLQMLPERRWNILAALSASLMWAFSRTLWGQAVVTEAYAPAAFFLSLMLYLLIRHQGKAKRKHRVCHRFLLAAFVAGLGVGVHLTLVLALPFFLLEPKLHGKCWAGALLAFAAGLAPYSMLPILAAGNPPVDWGHPVTLHNFLWVVSGGPYRRFFMAVPPGEIPARVSSWVGWLWQNGGWWGLLPAAAGIWVISSRRQRFLQASLVSAFLYSAYAITYNTSDSYVYLIPVAMLIVPWTAHGLLSAGEWAGRYLPPAAIAAVLVALPLAPLAQNWAYADLHEDRNADRFARGALAEAPPHAMILVSGDGETFALWYARYGLRMRPDVAVVNRDLWLQFGWYRATLEREHPDFTWKDPAGMPVSVVRLVSLNIRNHPVCMTYRNDALARGHSIVKGRFLWRISPAPPASSREGDELPPYHLSDRPRGPLHRYLGGALPQEVL